MLAILALPAEIAAAEGRPPSVSKLSAVKPADASLAPEFKRADFGSERVSQAARHVADWIVDSNNNRGTGFVIIDKTQAKVFVFEANGRLKGAAPALLGLARGDHSVPGIGEREIGSIRPEERTTPAGRFEAERGVNHKGEDIVWVDYDAAVSLHRIRANNPKENRLQRLATPTPADNRISFGCINVPARFYENVVLPAFTGPRLVVYVLPETQSMQKVFGSYDVTTKARGRVSS